MLFVVNWPNSIHLTAGEALIGNELRTPRFGRPRFRVAES